MLINTSKTL